MCLQEWFRTVNANALKYLPILGIIVLVIIISGCTSPNVATPTSTATPTIVPSPVATAIAVPMTTASPVPQAPSAYFSYTYNNDTAPLTVSFSDESLNGPTSWSWSFGDGVVSTQQNPVHIYKSPGDYTVTLTATNANGQSTSSETITLQATPTFVAGYVPLPRETTQLNNIIITEVNYQFNYTNLADNYFGSPSQTASTIPDVPDGITTFTCSLTLTNQGSNSDHTVNSIRVLTPGFTLLSVTPSLPTSSITPGSDIILALTIQAQISKYYGPLVIEVNPS
jgi:PKD repeat protein